MEIDGIRIKGKQLQCSHCGGVLFSTRDAQLNTSFMTLLGLDWLNTSADVFVCRRCGHLEWFLELKDQSEDLSQPTECLSCHSEIPAGRDTCPNCGWSYIVSSNQLSDDLRNQR